MDTRKKLELERWLTEQNFQFNKISRDFADGVAIAKIIKTFRPRLVELHNYSPANGHQMKMENWGLLNKKVFPRIGLPQKLDDLQRFAKGDKDALEGLLYKLMEMAPNYKKELQTEETQKYWLDEGDVVEAEVEKKVGDTVVKVKQKLVPLASFLELRKVISKHDEKVAAIQQKLAHLECLVDLKSEQIEDLQCEVAELFAKNIAYM